MSLNIALRRAPALNMVTLAWALLSFTDSLWLKGIILFYRIGLATHTHNSTFIMEFEFH